MALNSIHFSFNRNKLWQEEMSNRLNMLISKHILQEKRAERAECTKNAVQMLISPNVSI